MRSVHLHSLGIEPMALVFLTGMQHTQQMVWKAVLCKLTFLVVLVH